MFYIIMFALGFVAGRKINKIKEFIGQIFSAGEGDN